MSNRRPGILLGFVCAALFAMPTLVQAADCGVLEAFGGRLQVISADRTVVTEPALKMPVACGSWVATYKGWARVRHRGDFVMHVGSNSFFQVSEGKGADDHGVLYRGYAYLESLPGAGELRVLTANGRARVQRGPVVLSFDSKDEQTQMIALGNSGTLENRFAPTRRITLRAGEFSSMNFKLLRVVPSAAAPASVAGLKSTLVELNLSAAEIEVAMKTAKAREASRGLASVGRHGAKAGGKAAAKREKKHGQQTLAKADPSKKSAKAPGEGYERHRRSDAAQDARVKDHFVRKISAGDEAAEDILFPAQSVGRAPSSIVRLERVGESAPAKAKKGRQDDKQKLIDELSRIRSE